MLSFIWISTICASVMMQAKENSESNRQKMWRVIKAEQCIDSYQSYKRAPKKKDQKSTIIVVVQSIINNINSPCKTIKPSQGGSEAAKITECPDPFQGQLRSPHMSTPSSFLFFTTRIHLVQLVSHAKCSCKPPHRDSNHLSLFKRRSMPTES